VPGRGRFARQLQIRTASAVANLHAGRLSPAELAWLTQAMLALVRAS
jgi:hypothetical protein